jgi:hypothetical protein
VCERGVCGCGGGGSGVGGEHSAPAVDAHCCTTLVAANTAATTAALPTTLSADSSLPHRCQRRTATRPRPFVRCRTEPSKL